MTAYDDWCRVHCGGDFLEMVQPRLRIATIRFTSPSVNLRRRNPRLSPSLSSLVREEPMASAICRTLSPFLRIAMTRRFIWRVNSNRCDTRIPEMRKRGDSNLGNWVGGEDQQRADFGRNGSISWTLKAISDLSAFCPWTGCQTVRNEATAAACILEFS